MALRFFGLVQSSRLDVWQMTIIVVYFAPQICHAAGSQPACNAMRPPAALRAAMWAGSIAGRGSAGGEPVAQNIFMVKQSHNLMKMKITRFALTTVLWIGLLEATRAATLTYYVATNGTGNGTTWALATSNIQAAVTSTVAGDIVLVSNGAYYCWAESSASGYTSMVTVTKAITIQSVNGPEVTIVDANYPWFTNRCFYIASGAIVSGFTITNGHTINGNGIGGGGVFINTSGIVTNCWITGNAATNGTGSGWNGGGGVHLENGGEVVNCQIYANYVDSSTYRGGAGVFGHSAGSVRDCIISNNNSMAASATEDYAVKFYYGCLISNCTVINNLGGGVSLANNDVADGCRIIGNTAQHASLDGAGMVLSGASYARNCWIINNVSRNRAGGVHMNGGSVMSNCVVSSNYAASNGGGIELNAADPTPLAQNCTITSNRAASSGGGVYNWRGGTLRNCLISSNTASSGGGIYLWVAAGGTGLVENCTIVNNYASSQGGGIYNDSSAGTGTVVNTIVYSNLCASTNVNWIANTDISTNRSYFNCCITPTNNLPGNNNITNAPVFSDYAAYNFRLTPSSPCANAALLLGWMNDTAVDLDGRRRVDRFSGRPDMGCYELAPKGTMIRVR